MRLWFEFTAGFFWLEVVSSGWDDVQDEVGRLILVKLRGRLGKSVALSGLLWYLRSRWSLGGKYPKGGSVLLTCRSGISNNKMDTGRSL